jgi:hypothetical protein
MYTTVPCRPGTPRTGFKTRQVAGRASMRCRVPCNSRPCLPVGIGSNTATCPVAPDLASWLRWAPALPRVLWLRTSPLNRGRLQTLPPNQGGFRCCYTSHDSQWVVGLRYIKKGLVGLAMPLVTRVSKARPHVSEAPDTLAIMACKTCGQAAPLMPARRADMRLQCCAGPVDHTQDTTTVQGDPTGWYHAGDCV